MWLYPSEPLDPGLQTPAWAHTPLVSAGGLLIGTRTALSPCKYALFGSRCSLPGAALGTGDTSLFLAFKRHPAVAPHLAAQDEARWHLVAQWPRYHRLPLEYSPEELGRLLDNVQAAASPPDWPARLAEALRESRANEQLMLAWLDGSKEGSA